MRIVIIGAVAAGTSAAAKARRNDDFAEIVIYEKDQDISYSGCGLPYYIGDEIKDIEELTPRDEKFFDEKYDIKVKTQHEVTHVNMIHKRLTIKNLVTGETFNDHFDKLILATGARPFVPKIDGIDQKHVFFLRNVQNAIAIKTFIQKHKPKSAIIAGTGFIGFEVLENLLPWNIKVKVVEVMNKITPNLDEDMALLLENKLIEKGIEIIKGTGITEIHEDCVTLSSGKVEDADIVILATGVRPNVDLAKAMGLRLGTTGAIWVDDTMRTSHPDVYAAGDCIETYNSITKQAVYRPLGTTANKTGRIAGDNISRDNISRDNNSGGLMHYHGNLSTGIFKLFDLSIGSTGLSEVEARKAGYDIEVIHNIKPHRPSYFDGEEMVIKAIADRSSKQLLGVQIIGTEGVDKRLDVFATLITYHAKVDELFHLDLSYAPPFSTTKDPVHYTGMILDNAIERNRKILPNTELDKIKGLQIVDARTDKDFTKKGHVENAISMPHAELRKRLNELDPKKPVVTYCNKGTTGNAAQNILLNRGFKQVYNLSGGHQFYKATRVKKEK